MSTYTVTMSFVDEWSRRVVGEYHEEFSASGVEDAIEYARFASCEEGGGYYHPLAAVYVDYEVWTGGRMIDQGSINV